MPTSKTIYSTFDGEEFDNEEKAKAHEEEVRKSGVELRKKFLDGDVDKNYLPYIEPKLLEFIRSYPDDDAWLIMRSLKTVEEQLRESLYYVNAYWVYRSYDCDKDQII